MIVAIYFIFIVGLSAYLGYTAGYSNALEDIESRERVRKDR